jgi:predicted nucleic-acid-binding Zn-ribbon protein
MVHCAWLEGRALSKVIRKLIVCPACGNGTFEVEGIELDGEFIENGLGACRNPACGYTTP